MGVGELGGAENTANKFMYNITFPGSSDKCSKGKSGQGNSGKNGTARRHLWGDDFWAKQKQDWII